MSGRSVGPYILPREFYARDTVTVARELLGCVIVSTVGGVVTSGRIVETEAYLGSDDPGSHAATKGMTRRNAVMYGEPGHAYVYFTYGNHHMLNLVAEPPGTAGGVLLRALVPLTGIAEMERRRGGHRSPLRPLPVRDLANGPGKLAAALGVDLSCNGSPLDGSATLFVLGPWQEMGAVSSSGRIGLSAGHEAQLRFFIEGDPHVSRARPGVRTVSRPRGVRAP